MMTSKLARIALVATIVLGVGAVPASAKKGPKKVPIITFATMYGVDGGFVGDTNPIRGVFGDELPWVVKGSAKGKVESDGHVKIRVRGLVFTNDPQVPTDKQGKNDEPQFRAMVSCLTEQGETATPVANVETTGFTASPIGNADIDAKVTLPNPCVAPIVFVLAGSEEKWFAATGFEASEASSSTR